MSTGTADPSQPGAATGSASPAPREQGQHVRRAAKWIGVLALVFAVSTPVLFAMRTMETDKALLQLEGLPDSQELEPIDGKTFTAGELRFALAHRPRQELIGGGIMAVVMTGLWLWARRAPLPAIGCALALFIVVQVASALIDPSSIVGGLVVKVLALGALGKGLKAAIDARAETRGSGA